MSPGVTPYPFIVSTLCWESRPGQWSLTACLKATYALVPGDEPALAPQQDGTHEDVFFEQNPHGSLYSPSDFVPFKPRADVLLVGSASIPPATDAVTVRLRVGTLAKALRITGDRAGAGARVPLRYERASRRGENLVGLVPGQADRAPSIDVEAPAETPGFGPIAPLWRAHANPRAQETLAWSQRLRAEPPPGPAPAVLYPLALNAAPRDQQLHEIPAGTPILLEGLHPRFPTLETRVPTFVPRAFHVDPQTGQGREILARIDTLWIDTDREVLVVSWRGAVAVPGPSAAAGRIVTAVHAPGVAATFEEIDALARGAASGPRAPSRRGSAATLALPEMPSPAPASAPFPLAAPAAAPDAAAAKPIAGAPWAAVPAAPVPRPSKHLEGTLPLGASLPLPGMPAPDDTARPRRAPATMMLERAPVPAAPAPFPLAAPASGNAPSEAPPIAGAPWASVPAAPVPRPDKHLEGTMPLGASLSDVVAGILGKQRASEAPPPATPALAPAPPPPPEPPAPAPKPPEALWRVDAPEPARPAAPPPAPAAPDVRKQVYGDFTRKKR